MSNTRQVFSGLNDLMRPTRAVKKTIYEEFMDCADRAIIEHSLCDVVAGLSQLIEEKQLHVGEDSQEYKNYQLAIDCIERVSGAVDMSFDTDNQKKRINSLNELKKSIGNIEVL